MTIQAELREAIEKVWPELAPVGYGTGKGLYQFLSSDLTRGDLIAFLSFDGFDLGAEGLEDNTADWNRIYKLYIRMFDGDKLNPDESTEKILSLSSQLRGAEIEIVTPEGTSRYTVQVVNGQSLPERDLSFDSFEIPIVVEPE